MLSGKEKRNFRAQSNRIKATVHIGKEGVSEKVLRFIDQAFGNKELVKVKILEVSREDYKKVVSNLAELPDTEIVQTLGRTVLLYRKLHEE